MGSGNFIITRGSGKLINTSNIQGLVENQLGQQSTNWFTKYEPGIWVAIWANDTLDADEGHIILTPRSSTLLTSDALQTLWYFIQASKANLSFDPSIGFLYKQVTIVGDVSLEDSIDLMLERQLNENREVERIPAKTANELIEALNIRLDNHTYFKP